MFSIISIMFLGIGIGYLLRNLKFLEKVERVLRLRYSCYFSCWAFR